MTYPAALAITGAVLFVAAGILAIASDDTFSGRLERRYATLGWILLGASALCEIAAVWWAAS